MLTLEKSGTPPNLPMMSSSRSVKLFTTAPKEVAMMTATASSTRLPRSRNSLKPVSVLLTMVDASLGVRGLRVSPPIRAGH